MIRRIIYSLLALTLIASCTASDDSGSGGETDGFDRQAILANLADNIILPALVNFQSEMADLDVAKATFVSSVNEDNLDNLSDAWLEAYKAWQYIEMFNIGEAETQGGNDKGFVTFFNIYPVTVSDIQNGASSGSYDLDNANYHDAQGFPALDFLIHGVAETDDTAIAKFTTNTNANGYVDYLNAVQSQMNLKFSAIINDWDNGYRDTFVNNTSSSVTGSFSKIVNDYVNYYERGLRANKIGIPAGNFSNEPLPTNVEAFYRKDVSRELALLGLEAARKVFNGQSLVGGSSASGESFASYLDFLDRTDLKEELNSRFLTANSKIEALDNNFSQQITSDNSKMTEAYDALQLAVVHLKVDMVSVFNVSVDFQDNDGD